MLCYSCLFYENHCLYENEVHCIDLCHCHDGVYDKDKRSIVEPLFIEECESYHKTVLSVLSDLEKEFDITIIFAVESGSRVWGFDNSESDFDIRFVFKYNKVEEYFRLDKIRDVITKEYGLFDIVGWDIGKALWLAYKSNPSLREWLLSDYIYVYDYEDNFRGLDFEDSVLLHHYNGMAFKNWNDFCEGVYDWVGGNDENRLIKKYLYVLRCILTWHIIKETSMVPKLNIVELVGQYRLVYNDEVLANDIFDLIEKYKGLNNNLTNKTVNRLREYITSNLRYMKEENKKLHINKRDIKIYNHRYYEIIMGR